VLERTRAAVAEVAPTAAPSPGFPGEGRHRSGGRLFGRRRQEEPEPVPTGPLLDLLPAVAMHVPIAKFGNLALADATRLADEMDRQATSWETPRLHISGGVALEPEGDSSVWVCLAGDLDALAAVARGVTRAAQALHIFVDRRSFRPHVELGQVNDRTSTAHLEDVLAMLGAYESTSWWQTTVTLLVPTDLGPGQPPFKTFRDIPLGPAVAH
jgi:2'-5' RNA ligase